MRTCVTVLLVAFSGPSIAQTAQTAPESWTIPSDDAISSVLSDRLRIEGAGMVVGVIEPAGRRIVAYGRSGSADGRPLDGDTIFQIGSVTKVFTTLLLADMVVRGEVSLDDAASRYLEPGVSMPTRGRPITLRDLATHTSGLPSMPNNFSLQADPDPITAYTPRALHRFLSNYRLQNDPGEKWAYSNLGVALLGRLLGSRSRSTYETLLAARVLAPLGLRSTAITLTSEQARRVAPGLDRYGQPAATWEMRTLQGSGSLRSSANDLLEFLAVYLGTRQSTLNPAVTLQLSTRAPARHAQALGWGTGKVGDREVFMHDGGKPGYRSLIAFDPERRRGVVVLVNAHTDERLSVIALHLLTGKPMPPARAAAGARQRESPAHRTLAPYAGNYRLETGRVIEIVGKHDYLVVDIAGEGPAMFVAAGNGSFFDPSGENELSFDPAVDGPATFVTWYEHGRAEGNGAKGLRIKTR